MIPVVVGIEGHELSADETEAILRLQPAGFVLFSRNIASVEQVRILTDSLRRLCRHHPIIAVDQEGGRVIRTAGLGLHLPFPEDISVNGDFAKVEELASITALALRYLGINMNFAPVLDIKYHPCSSNALPERCWGSDARTVISLAGVYAANLQRGGVQNCGKHFPGMGRAGSDPHFSLPVIDLDERELFASDLLPFMALCPVLSGIMSAHIMLPRIDPEFPVTLSVKIMRGLLRDRLDFRGVVFTDDLCMGAIAGLNPPDEAAFLAWKAGCDLPLICHESLAHLERLAPRLAGLDSYEQEDSLRRVEKLTDSLYSPLMENAALWQSCLNRAERLCDLVGHRNDGGTPSSPVQQY